MLQGNWQDRIATPFLHLTSDNFWELVKNGDKVTLQQFGTGVSVRQLQTMVDGGSFAGDLWNLLSDAVARRTLRRILLTTYFPQHEIELQSADTQNPLDAEAERLIAAADRPFRIKINQKEIDSDGADGSYVRSAVFPRVIKNLYGATCAVCGMDVRNGQSDSLLIDAAHVVPFFVSHNDDPRNGLALCRNHHAGFDHGWYGVAENYKLVVSPRLVQSIPYVRAGEPLRLPSITKYAPAKEALAWHRNHNRLDSVK